MIDDVLVEAVTKICNAKIKKKYPLMGEHFKTCDVRIVCEAFLELAIKMKEKR